MAQKFAPAGDNSEDEIQEAGQVQAQGSSIDDLLDEIDSVLETDAQKFVQGFVQKGGE
ncbi:ubiquitin-like protein Pup [Actinomyces urinae]|uniref:ubiquitin-like protein Pup n=1 Tax=Actinomyces urinae TaxID=1689268 RepID=UPI0009310EC5|nr:ubiquitin-like protein Pup [Actinomyces urinae]